jgi:hypothetical protein
MRPVVGASNSAESCCCRSRLRSSRPNRAIRNDNGLGADTVFSDATFARKSFCVGCVAARWTPIHFIATPLRRRRAEPPATRTPPGVKQPSPDGASSPDQAFASHELRLNSNKGGGGNLDQRRWRRKRSLRPLVREGLANQDVVTPASARREGLD